MILGPDEKLTPHMVNELLRQSKALYGQMDYKGSGLDNERRAKFILQMIHTLSRDTEYGQVAKIASASLRTTLETDVKAMVDSYLRFKGKKGEKIKRSQYELVSQKAISKIYSDIKDVLSFTKV